MENKEKSEILKEYGLDESSIFNLVHKGIDNNLYIINDAEGKKYVLRESKRKYYNKNIGFEVELLLLLTRLSIKAPNLIISRNNSYYVVASDRYFVLFGYIAGHQFESVSGELLLKNIIRLGGKKLGELHNATKNLDINIDSKRTIFTEFERFFSIPIEKLAQFDGYAEFLKYVNKFYNDSKNLMQNEKIKSGIIHNDYRIQNLIFSKDNTDASIIDFDWSCCGPFLKDIGLAIVEWSIFDFKRGPSREAIQQFIDGYNSIGLIQIKYNRELLFWICFSCLSDACTFFSDIVIESRHDDLSIDKVEQCQMYKKFKYFLEEYNRAK